MSRKHLVILRASLPWLPAPATSSVLERIPWASKILTIKNPVVPHLRGQVQKSWKAYWPSHLPGRQGLGGTEVGEYGESRGLGAVKGKDRPKSRPISGWEMEMGLEGWVGVGWGAESCQQARHMGSHSPLKSSTGESWLSPTVWEWRKGAPQLPKQKCSLKVCLRAHQIILP